MPPGLDRCRPTDRGSVGWKTSPLRRADRNRRMRELPEVVLRMPNGDATGSRGAHPELHCVSGWLSVPAARALPPPAAGAVDGCCVCRAVGVIGEPCGKTVCTVLCGGAGSSVTVTLHGHEAGNDGHGQRGTYGLEDQCSPLPLRTECMDVAPACAAMACEWLFRVTPCRRLCGVRLQGSAAALSDREAPGAARPAALRGEEVVAPVAPIGRTDGIAVPEHVPPPRDRASSARPLLFGSPLRRP